MEDDLDAIEGGVGAEPLTEALVEEIAVHRDDLARIEGVAVDVEDRLEPGGAAVAGSRADQDVDALDSPLTLERAVEEVAIQVGLPGPGRRPALA